MIVLPIVLRIQLDMLVVLGILSAALHWFVARSRAMQWFWSRMQGRIGALLACPACSGWWISLGLGLLGVQPVVAPWVWPSAILAGLLGIVLTPVFEALLLWGLAVSAIPQPAPDAEAPAPTAELRDS
jgi:hypothetical protein